MKKFKMVGYFPLAVGTNSILASSKKFSKISICCSELKSDVEAINVAEFIASNCSDLGGISLEKKFSRSFFPMLNEEHLMSDFEVSNEEEYIKSKLMVAKIKIDKDEETIGYLVATQTLDGVSDVSQAINEIKMNELQNSVKVH
jgi:hypothetical protein